VEMNATQFYAALHNFVGFCKFVFLRPEICVFIATDFCFCGRALIYIGNTIGVFTK
jgi:hypothetical protein